MPHTDILTPWASDGAKNLQGDALKLSPRMFTQNDNDMWGNLSNRKWNIKLFPNFNESTLT